MLVDYVLVVLGCRLSICVLWIVGFVVLFVTCLHVTWFVVLVLHGLFA